MRMIPTDAERFYCGICPNCEAWASPTAISLKCGECGADMHTDSQWEAYWLDAHLSNIDALEPIPWMMRATFAHDFIAALDKLDETDSDHPELIKYEDACRIADTLTRYMDEEYRAAAHRFVRRYLDYAAWNKSLSEWACDWAREEVETIVT